MTKREEGVARLSREDIRKAMLLYAVTDRRWLEEGQTLLDQVASVLIGGATCVQLREKDGDHAHLLAEAEGIRVLCAARGVPFIVDDDVALACQVGADGVHVGQDDMEVRRARKTIGPEMVLGVSVQTVEQALDAQAAGADYLGVGAVFATGTKADAADVSFQTLCAITAAVDIPVVAIGGIDHRTVLKLFGSGIDGIAVVSALFAAADKEAAARQLLEESRFVVLGNGIRGIIFDMDGTLTDTMPLWRDSGSLYLRRQGIEPPENLHEVLLTLDLGECADYLIDRFKLDKEHQQVCDEINAMLEDMYFNIAPLKPGIREFIEQEAQRGIRMCVVTATDKYLADAIFARTGIDGYFTYVFTCTEVGSSKSHPFIFEKGAASLDVPKEGILVLDDALYAIESAHAAGFKTVGIYDRGIGEQATTSIKEVAEAYLTGFAGLEETS